MLAGCETAQRVPHRGWILEREVGGAVDGVGVDGKGGGAEDAEGGLGQCHGRRETFSRMPLSEGVTTTITENYYISL